MVDNMKLGNGFAGCADERSRYEAPQIEVVEISVERGFEVSFDGPSYDEEDVEW